MDETYIQPPPSPLATPRAVDNADHTAPLQPPASTPLQPPAETLDELRRGVLELASSEALDKPAALAVTRLFHAMETLLRHECTLRDRRIDEARNELETLRLQAELERYARALEPPPPEPEPELPSRRRGSRW